MKEVPEEERKKEMKAGMYEGSARRRENEKNEGRNK